MSESTGGRYVEKWAARVLLLLLLVVVVVVVVVSK